MENLQSIREELGNISPSFCLAKWYQTSILLQNGLTHSCHHPAPHKISAEEIAKNPGALHNTARKIEARHQMLIGERPPECSYCWNLEDNNEISDRLFKSNESWAKPFLREALDPNQITAAVPRYLEVSFEATCNFKCAYCSPQSSSRWQEEARSFGPYPTSDRFGNYLWFQAEDRLPSQTPGENKYTEAFWKWWPQIKSKVLVLRITGGEPLLSKHTWKIIDDILNNPQPNLHLAINSNMGVAHELVVKLVDKINALEGKIARFTLFHSMDTVQEQAEYIRFGLDYDLYQENVEYFLRQTKWRVRATMISTLNVLSIAGFPKLLEWNLELRKKFPEKSLGLDTPYLRYPEFLSARILTEEFLAYFDTATNFLQSNLDEKTGFTLRELERWKRVRSWIVQSYEKQRLAQLRRDLFGFLVTHDERRSTNFLKTFPEYDAFLKVCLSTK